MRTVATEPRYTPLDLLTMPDGDRYELVEGHLVERNMSTWSSYVAGSIYFSLRSFCQLPAVAWIFPEGTSCQCFPDAPGKVRKPDVSVIRLDRMSREQAQDQGHIAVRPDLAVEVLSPNDLAYEVDTKVRELLAAGVHLVWVVNPDTHEIVVHRQDGSVGKFREEDEISGENVLPGYHALVAEFFKAPASPPPQTNHPS